MTAIENEGGCTPSIAVAYAFCQKLKPQIEESHAIVQQLPDDLEWGGVRDSLRQETQTLLAVQAGSTQTQLEELQDDSFNRYLDISKLISKISIGGLEQHNIDLLRCHPFYKENRTLVERFIFSMKWQGPTDEDVSLADQSLLQMTDFDRIQGISFTYNQTDRNPVRILYRKKLTSEFRRDNSDFKYGSDFGRR